MKFFFLLNKIPFRQQSSLLRLFKLLLNVFNFLLQFIFLSKVSFTFFFFELLFEGFNFFVLGWKKKKRKRRKKKQGGKTVMFQLILVRNVCDLSIYFKGKCLGKHGKFLAKINSWKKRNLWQNSPHLRRRPGDWKSYAAALVTSSRTVRRLKKKKKTTTKNRFKIKLSWRYSFRFMPYDQLNTRCACPALL